MAVSLVLSCAAIAHAEGEAHPGLEVSVGLAAESGGEGDSLGFDLTPAEPGSRALPPVRAVRLTGYLGSLDLQGIPTCKPSIRSTRASGCTVPSIRDAATPTRARLPKGM
jgi:hypothetical protein